MLARRGLLGLALFGTALTAERAAAQSRAQAAPASAPAPPVGAFGLDASTLGVRPGSPDDQSRRLQEALVQAANRDAPLLLPPGRYRVSNVVLPDGARLIGVGGASVLTPAGAGPILAARRVKRVALEQLTLDGQGGGSGDMVGLLNAEDVAEISLHACEFRNGGGNGVTLTRSGGRIAECRFSLIRNHGLFSLDSRGLFIEGNVLEDIGNNAISVWRSKPGDDNSRISGNRISRVRMDAGGDGPNGNGVAIYRAGGVIVAHNSFRDCAMTFVRNNSGNGVQILGNQGLRCGEVGYYSEFAFEGAILANNLAEDVAQGFNITNLDHGGRLAICANNLVRRVKRRPIPKGSVLVGGLGIHVEAEASVTGNVVEDVSDIGISLGWSWGMRNLVATGNMVRQAGIGIGVSLVPKDRNVVVANNVIAGARQGAVVGTEYGKMVTGDLTRAQDRRAAGVRVEGNAVS